MKSELVIFFYKEEERLEGERDNFRIDIAVIFRMVFVLVRNSFTNPRCSKSKLMSIDWTLRWNTKWRKPPWFLDLLTHKTQTNRVKTNRVKWKEKKDDQAIEISKLRTCFYLSSRLWQYFLFCCISDLSFKVIEI